ncbi:MAG: hypothetical protein ACKO9Z_15155 [Planctomycetota bacterium]
MLKPETIAKIALGLLAFGGLLAVLGLFSALWIIPLAVGGTFTATSFQAGRVCYPRQPALWAACAALPLGATIVSFVVIEQARQIGVGMVVRKHDSQLRTDISTMLRDNPADYPPEQAEALRLERLGRIEEILANPYRSETTVDSAMKARVFLAEELPRERGFRYRVNQGRLTRQLSEIAAAATGEPSPGPISLPPGGLMAALEDRAGLGARFLRFSLVDLWADRDLSRRAGCELEEVRHLLVFRWGEPVIGLTPPRRSYPCEIVLLRVPPGGKAEVAGVQAVASMATDDDLDDGGSQSIHAGGDPARSEAVRRKIREILEGPHGKN